MKRSRMWLDVNHSLYASDPMRYIGPQVPVSKALVRLFIEYYEQGYLWEAHTTALDGLCANARLIAPVKWQRYRPREVIVKEVTSLAQHIIRLYERGGLLHHESKGVDHAAQLVSIARHAVADPDTLVTPYYNKKTGNIKLVRANQDVLVAEPT